MEVSNNNLNCHKKCKSEQILRSETESLKDSSIDSGSIQKQTVLPKSSLFEGEKTKVICYGITGIILVVIANLIILGNNVLIKEYGIDYVDMILLRSAVQLLTLGLVIKMKGN